MNKQFILPALFATAISVPAQAALVAVDWSSTSAGTLGSVSVALSGLSGTPSLASLDLSGTDYDAAPLSGSQESVLFQRSSDWSATFGTPASDLLVYGYAWKLGNYTFNTAFSILDGFETATINGNTLELPAGNHNGILSFSSPLTSLTVDSTSVGILTQGLTFALDDAQPAPAPSTLALFGLLSLPLLFGARGRRSL
jgi:hypothetical protein